MEPEVLAYTTARTGFMLTIRPAERVERNRASPETVMDETAGGDATLPVRVKSPGASESYPATGSDIVSVTVVPEEALAAATVGARPSDTISSASSSWFVPSVTPPESGLV